jgi:predicted RNA-binding protein YlqC (UPF0109 family)
VIGQLEGGFDFGARTSPRIEACSSPTFAFAGSPLLWDAANGSPAALASSPLALGDLDMSANVSLKELIEYIAKALVDNPDEVDVSEVSGEQTVVLELRVAKDDLGKVIGKQGRTVKAMRAILNAASSKVRKRADLEILE